MPKTVFTFTRPSSDIKFYMLDAETSMYFSRNYLETGKVSYNITMSGPNTLVTVFSYDDPDIYNELTNDDTLNQMVNSRRLYNERFNIIETVSVEN